MMSRFCAEYFAEYVSQISYGISTRWSVLRIEKLELPDIWTIEIPFDIGKELS